jgi:hypothetical protein
VGVKRVLLLATTTGYQIRSFGEAADRLGIRLLLASDRCDRLDDPWWDGAIPVRFHETPRSLDVVVAACRGQSVSGVVAVGDRPAVLAAHVSEALGLPGNPPEAAEASRNKLATRRAFAAAGLPTPDFRVISHSEGPTHLPGLEYPVVVKPLALSGSQGVIRADDESGLSRAIERVRRLLQSTDIAIERDNAHQQLLIERFIPGREYAVEGLLTNGRLRVLAIFDKPDPLDGPFFEETIYITPSRAAETTQRAIVDAVAGAATALGLRHGPVHAECRVYGTEIYVLEVAARPIGGLCAKAIRFTAANETLTSLEEVLLRHAVGEPLDRFGAVNAARGVMMIPIPRRGVYRGVRGVDDARRVAGIDDVTMTAKPGVTLVPLPEGRSYLGFIFASAGTAAAAELALREAHSRMQFIIDREVTLAR